MIKGSHLTEEHKLKMSLSTKGRIISDEWRKNISLGLKGRIFSESHLKSLSVANTKERNPMWGKHHSEESKKKKSLTSTGKPNPMSKDARIRASNLLSSMNKKRSGENHYMWKKDRSSLTKRNHVSMMDESYSEWRTSVFSRDGWMCKIKNENCDGQLEVHHILPWRDFVELRFNINNGITLCHAHHPRKRAEEKRLIPTFQELVSVSKDPIF
jgi:hypothetical protein